jgi:hypothetical protein
VPSGYQDRRSIANNKVHRLAFRSGFTDASASDWTPMPGNGKIQQGLRSAKGKTGGEKGAGVTS